MLRELHISNLAVIEDASVDFTQGLNVFTGRTGAGKSLVIGAFEILLGLRSGGKNEAGAMLRDMNREARVSGLFEVWDAEMATLMGEAVDSEITINEPVLITRRILPSGRSSATVNGLPVTIPMLRKLAEFLVDIHGQHDHQFMLKPYNQLLILDSYANCLNLRQEFGTSFRQLSKLKQKKQDLMASDDARARELELLEFQANEIDSAEAMDGELESIQLEFEKLSNIGDLMTGTSECVDVLHESEGAIIEKLEILTSRLKSLADKDKANIMPIFDQLTDCSSILKDAACDLSSYADSLEPDEGRLEEVQSRLDTLNHLVYKYGGSLTAVADRRESIGARIHELKDADGDFKGLDKEISKLEDEIEIKGKQLSKVRHDSIARLSPLISERIRRLGMDGAEFDAEFNVLHAKDPDVTSAGFDKMEFFVRTNPGQPRRAMRKVASGGEISRIMLAIKSEIAASDRISVLVFDEIGASVGGRLGSEIGSCMKQLAKRHHGRQVLCITHMPQIAAFADHHLHVEKKVSKINGSEITHSSVKVLNEKQRLEELADMITGEVTKASLTQARELISKAEKL